MWATVYDLDPETWDKIPDNVTSLPTQSSGAIVDNGDGTATVQYQIVPRATWSDGMPMTGADLAFTAEAMRILHSTATHTSTRSWQTLWRPTRLNRLRG